jgi:hypothetical protein
MDPMPLIVPIRGGGGMTKNLMSASVIKRMYEERISD